MSTTRPDWRTRLGRYRQMKVRRVDLVPAGANPEAIVHLAKSADPVPVSKENPAMPIPEALADLSPEDIDAIGTYVTDLAAQLEAERLRNAPAPSEDELLKSAPPEIVERIQKAEAEAAVLARQVQEIQKAERTRVFKGQAADLVNLSGGDDGAEALGAILEKAEAALGSDYAELHRVLIAADAQVGKAGSLFGSVGSDDTETASIEALAKTYQDEGMPALEALKKARRTVPQED